MNKKIIQFILKILASLVIRKYRPTVIGITGSVGKSSTKEAIYTVLKKYFSVRASPKNYNNEIGVPLTILGQSSATRSFFGWLLIFLRGFGLIIFKNKNYPKILVLEMAADHPGDISYLLKIAPCQIGVITAIGPTHLEFFKTVENVAQEKSLMVTKLNSHHWAVLNADDPRVISLKPKIKARTLTFGINQSADIKAVDLNLSQELINNKLKIDGLMFKLHYSGNFVPVVLPEIIAFHQTYAVLAAAAVGLILELNLIEISEALKDFRGLPGRMKLLSGKNNSQIIDDSYNSSPKAVEMALETLNKIKISPEARKWVVLGDMLELGSVAQEEHFRIGRLVGQNKVNYLLAVGKFAKDIIAGAQSGGMSADQLFSFTDSLSAAKFLVNKIKAGDLILVKGSQGVRLERLVKEIMAEPKMAKELLVRQGDEWMV
jgi:UDP-N-acetylmuramoyl-tripeptide--D-alanyl-D-alanine ligase